MLVYVFTKDTVGNITALQVHNRATAEVYAIEYAKDPKFAMVWIETADGSGRLQYTLKSNNQNQN